MPPSLLLLLPCGLGRLLHAFAPVPERLLDGLVERKKSPKDGRLMKFFEKHLNMQQCEQV